MVKILISGGNGFLGSHLCEIALKNGFEVTVVDDISTSKKKQVPREVNFIKKTIETFKTKDKFDFVVHLAARPSPEDYIKNPLSTIDSNDLGTRNMLEIASKSDATFMYTSTSEVYGDPTILPTPESYFGYVNPNGIRSCYDESKRFSEALIKAYERKCGLDVRIQRPFNVYGPRIREDGFYGRVIPRFIDQALRNKPLTVYGDGKQTRSFLYIDDWLAATWKFLISKNGKGKVINIGHYKEISIIDLANLIINKTNSKSKVTHLRPREEDPKRRAADITEARKLLNWEPKVDLSRGLGYTINWLKEKKGL
ncbi:NAD-dependent epimerase/dehydratase family protein [Candidatus Parvarchaeota archaeon]|uniref:NAD-dependent epimerase/dehydratase family protein n=1 Tax=Candidatus Acidifodinimicrobium mancum TaxID=2898728 RepID=A0A8T3UUT6_9ARCH|nr:NAD-dependent epimerase/dehydratase family protein [Candidatus Acidifodinimicrobium mancum]